MILGLEIGMLIAGLIALIKGEFKLSNARVVRGGAARLAGFFLLLPLPVAFGFGFVFAWRQALRGQPLGADFATTALLVEIGGIVVCGLAAVVTALAGTATRSRYERDEDDEKPARRRRHEDRPAQPVIVLPQGAKRPTGSVGLDPALLREVQVEYTPRGQKPAASGANDVPVGRKRSLLSGAVVALVVGIAALGIGGMVLYWLWLPPVQEQREQAGPVPIGRAGPVKPPAVAPAPPPDPARPAVVPSPPPAVSKPAPPLPPLALEAPLVRPAVKPLPIKPAPLPAGKAALKLPAPARDVCVGGGGRFLLLHLPQLRQLAVFDASEARVVRYLPLEDDRVLFAASMDKLLLVLPEKNQVERWSLTSFAKEATATLPLRGRVVSVVMGSASDGSLILHGPDLRGAGAPPLCFLDLATLREIPVRGRLGRGMVSTHSAYPLALNVSADGRVLGLSTPGLSPTGLQTVVLDGNTITVSYEHTSPGEVVPGPDGRAVFTRSGLFTPDLKRLDGGGRDNRPELTVPALHGNYYLTLPWDEYAPQPAGTRRSVTVYQLGNTRPLFTLTDLEGLTAPAPASPQPNRGGSLPLTRRLFLIPAAELLVTIPATGDQLHLHRFDPDDALARSGIDYLLVTREPGTTAYRGRAYTGALAVKSKQGGVTYKLEQGPPQMKITSDGTLTWDVPINFTGADVDVVVTIADRTGQEVVHALKLAVKLPTGPAPPVTVRKPEPAQPPAQVVPTPVVDAALPEPIQTAPLKVDRETRPLPAPASSLVVGGGGRFLILHLATRRQLAIFDANAARVVKYIPLAEENVKIAAGLDRFFVLLPTANVLQRWSLATFERELTVANPVKGTVHTLLLGSASQGPLLLASTGNRYDGDTVLLDPRTLKPVAIERGAGRSPLAIGADSFTRVSGDGKVFTSYRPHVSPQGHTIFVLTGNTVRTYGRDLNVYGHVAPGPDGRYIYTPFGPFTSEGKPVGKRVQDNKSYGIPAAEGGEFYLSAEVPGFPHGDPRQPSKLSLRLAGDPRPVAALGHVELPPNMNQWGREPFAHDQRMQLIPSAKLLVVLPVSNDRLELYRVDVAALLARSSLDDYLLVSSQAPAGAKKGETYTYQLVALSRKGGIKYSVDAGPPGMKITPDGKLTWPVPNDHSEKETIIILSLRDAGGKECFHTFTINVRE